MTVKFGIFGYHRKQVQFHLPSFLENWALLSTLLWAQLSHSQVTTNLRAPSSSALLVLMIRSSQYGPGLSQAPTEPRQHIPGGGSLANSIVRNRMKTDGDKVGDGNPWPASSGHRTSCGSSDSSLADKSQLIFNRAPHCAAKYSPLSLLCTVLRQICVCHWTKNSSTGISGGQHRSFVLPSMKESSRIHQKGHQNYGMMKDSAAAWPGCHRPFLIFIAATVMIHLGYLPGWNIAFGPWGKHCQTIRMKAKTGSIYYLINQSPFKLLYFFSADVDWSTRGGI